MLGVYFAIWQWATITCAAQFAAGVVDYQPGIGFATDLATGAGYTEPSAVFGPPARETPGQWGGPVTPFSPPYTGDQLLSVGRGGSLTVEFDAFVFNEPSNPDGVDFLIFGGAGFIIINEDFSGGGITDGSLLGNATDGVQVSVSADNVSWFLLDPEKAVVPDAYFPTDGTGDFRKPVDPTLAKTDFIDKGLDGIRELYRGSGGGTGYDLAWAVNDQGKSVSIDMIRYVRIEVLEGHVEIDALSAVRPEPRMLAWNFEDFSQSPVESGWKSHGEDSLFDWDAEDGNLKAIWDSSKANHFFYRPLGMVWDQEHSFALAFDLTLDSIEVGLLGDKPYTFEVAVGLIHMESAFAQDFRRGTGADSPNLVEFDYFPDSGFGATLSPTVVSEQSRFAASFTFPAELAASKTYSVRMEFDPVEALLTSIVLENGKPFRVLKEVYLPEDFGSFQVDAFSVSSYTDTGSNGSILATGRVDNVSVSAGLAKPHIHSYGLVGGQWRGWFLGVTNREYLLERSTDLQVWKPVNEGVKQSNILYQLTDSTPKALPGKAVFYRVRTVAK